MTDDPILLGLLAAAVVLAAALVLVTARSRARRGELERQRDEIRTLKNSVRRMEEEHRFMLQCIREIPHLAGELSAQLKLRRVPEVLLDIVKRFFQPEQAVVLIRRRATVDDPQRDRQLITAAVATPQPDLRAGTVIALGQGSLGLVAETNRMMDRRDLERHRAAARSEVPEPMRVDLACPMSIAEDLLGLIALSRPRKHQTYGKDVLRLVAQMGAFTIRNVAAFHRVKSVADVDPLTGVFNKGVLNYRLGEAIYEAEGRHATVALFIFDIDHFKNYNDENGHVAGDQLLRSLAEAVKERVRADDILGRFGGEEFLLILPGRDAEQAAKVGEKIRSLIEAHEFPFGEKQPLGRVTISGGVACFPADGRNSTDLLEAADQALYRAKREGRNRVRIFSVQDAEAEAKADADDAEADTDANAEAES